MPARKEEIEAEDNQFAFDVDVQVLLSSQWFEVEDDFADYDVLFGKFFDTISSGVVTEQTVFRPTAHTDQMDLTFTAPFLSMMVMSQAPPQKLYILNA